MSEAEAALRGAAHDLVTWLSEKALPLWWRSGADMEHGGYVEALELDGTPSDRPRRARVQARQIYCFAASNAIGPFESRSAAVAHGLDYFLRCYRRPDGLYRTLVASHGAPLDDTAWLYDQAFALLALAEVQRLEPGRIDLEPLARETLEAIGTLRLQQGGFREASAQQPFQSNPHMHLLEAALAWEEVHRGSHWSGLANEIANLALERFIDKNGALHEFFAEGWAPATNLEGRIVEPGHQFEWSWLLRRWGASRKRTDAIGVAKRLFEIGVQHGIDKTRGVAFDRMLDDMTVHSSNARLWPQTERIKAAVAFWEAEVDPRRKDALAIEAVRAIGGLALYLHVAIPGLWRDNLGPNGRFVEEAAPASSFYHIVCAVLELQRALKIDRAGGRAP
jgi:mannose-6-phosphate isomerase